MRPVSAGFIAAVKREDSKMIREVSYKRRRWDVETKDYVWEDEWTVLPESRILQVSPVTEQLEGDLLNEIKVSNMTISARNEDNFFSPENPVGMFGRDTASPLFPYADHWTKFRMRVAVEVDGAYEYSTRFTGVLVQNIAPTPNEAQITIQGLEAILIRGDAEDVGVLVEGENIGTGDNSEQTFSTTFPAVGVVYLVTIGGIRKNEGEHFSVSGLNDAGNGAEITVLVGSGTGAVLVDYVYWTQDQVIEEIVEALASAAGVPEAAQQVETVIFPGVGSKIFTYGSQAQWGNATKDRMEALRIPGSAGFEVDVDDATARRVLEDYSSGDMPSFPAGSVDDYNFKQFTGGRVILGGINDIIPALTRPFGYRLHRIALDNTKRPYGVWEFNFRIESDVVGTAATPMADLGIYAHFAAVAKEDLTTASGADSQVMGYMVYGTITPDASGDVTFSLYKWTYASTGFVAGLDSLVGKVLLASGTFPQLGFGENYKIAASRSMSGKIVLSVNDTFVLEAEDTAYENFSHHGKYKRDMIAFAVQSVAGGPTYSLDFGDDSEVCSMGITYRPAVAVSGSVITEGIDMGSVPDRLGIMTAEEVVMPGYPSTLYSGTSDNGVDWDAFVVAGIGGKIDSEISQHIRFQWAGSVPTEFKSEAYLTKIIFDAAVQRTELVFADFAGKTIYEAIQILADISHYEFGFSPDEDFIFRRKLGSKTPVFDITPFILEDGLSIASRGEDRIRTKVKADLNGHFYEVSADNLAPGNIVRKYGKSVEEITGDGSIYLPNIDLAKGIAQAVAQDLFVPKRIFRARCKFLPFLDAADIVTFGYFNNKPRPVWHHGDTNAQLGDQSLRHFGGRDQMAVGLTGKIITFRHDDDRKNSEFEIMEVK